MAPREVPAVPARTERRALSRAAEPEAPAADGRLEAAADRFAERYESLAHGAVRPMPRLDSAASPTGTAGAPLDSATRADMEPRLGWDLSQVRVHTGRGAADSAAALGAQAYTVGRHIVLGDGVRPGSGAGQRLLAHELAHVAQQARGEGLGRLHRKPLPATGKKTKGKGRPFWVPVTREMGPVELLRAFVAQYYRSVDQAEITRRVPLWHWNKPGGLSATADDVARHGIWLTVTDVTQTALDRLPQAEREQINAEADQRFWEQNALAPGTKLGTGPEDATLRARWLGARADVASEHELLREIHALPADVKAILFAGQKPLVPEDYENVLRLGRRLDALTPAQRAAYRDKITGTTADWAELDASIGRFEAQQRSREADAERTEEAAATLFGCEELYRLWKHKNALHQQNIQASPYIGYKPDMWRRASEAEDEFNAALALHGFADERAFLSAVATYRLRFRTEAVNIALDVLDHYDHLLYEEERKLRTPGYVGSLVSGIARTNARADYAAAAEKESQARLARISADPDSSSSMLQAAQESSEYSAEADSLRNSAEKAVVTAAGDDPIIDPEKLGRATDREKLAGLDEPGTLQYLLGVINARRADTAQARSELSRDPDRVFSQPKLVSVTKDSLGADSDNVYGQIVDDHVESVRQDHIFSAVVFGIIALVLALLVPVGGWVAAPALVGNTVISVYQAVEAVKEYQKQSAEFRLSFITDDPSLAWVVVAVAAAALDLGTTAALVLKGSAKGLASLEGPLREFSAASDAESAAARFKTLAAKIDEAKGLEQGLKDALTTQAAATKGLEQVIGKIASRPMGFAGAVDLRLVMKGFYHLVRMGVSSFTKLRKQKQLLQLLGDVTKLPKAAKNELEAAFKEVEAIVDAGAKHKMDEATALEFIDRAAAARTAGGVSEFDSILAEAKAWRPPTREQIRAQEALGSAADELRSLRMLRAESLKELKGGPKTASGATDHARIAELRDNLEGLDDVRHVGRDGTTWTEQGAISRARAQYLAAERLAETARISPVKRMRAFFNGSAERAEISGSATIDQVGKLRSSSGGLEVDHVVSLDRMSQMEGFNKLKPLERHQLAVRKDNLVLMDASANSSKGPRSWSAWENASNYYPDPADVLRWKTKDADLTVTIQNWIRDTVRGR
ncbi:DUF4157 domain-containing protein [Streptomyces sp. NPDC060031]|uniref:eCIS core domain-containing protein n=1 Tax=Streptomyces sp. NPDC060031 TaxID=3347043 RepID=UPI0036909416